MTISATKMPSAELVDVPTAIEDTEAQSDSISETIIRPPSGWRLVNAGEMWRYRELLYFLTWRDVKVRYKQTLLGASWAVLQPAMMMVVFTVFFGRLADVPSGGIPYPLFVYAGLLPWTFFATAISSAGNSVVGSEKLITKIYFPRLTIPFAAVGAALVDFAVAFSLMLVLMVWYQVMPTLQLMLVPVLVVMLLLAGLGIGTMLAAMNVAYRDFKYMIPFLVQLGMFATPTVYMDVNAAVEKPAAEVANADQTGEPVNTVATDKAETSVLRWILELNPMTGIIAAFRGAILGVTIPWASLAVSAVAVVVLFFAGCLYFRRVESTFADII